MFAFLYWCQLASNPNLIVFSWGVTQIHHAWFMYSTCDPRPTLSPAAPLAAAVLCPCREWPDDLEALRTYAAKDADDEQGQGTGMSGGAVSTGGK